MNQQTSPLSAVPGIAQRWPWIPYTAPFVVFAVLTFLLPFAPLNAAAAYLVKSLAAGILLLVFWPVFKPEIRWTFDATAVLAGIGVFLLWVGLEGRYPQIGQSSFDPYASRDGVAALAVIGIRLAGATLVVPFVEEIFWRSFVMRFLVASRFQSVPLGRFTWYAFVMTAVAFGLEHHRWLPGIVAGIVYAALLCRRRNLFTPIMAHGVTNFLLGVYVIQTGQWSYW